MLKLLWLVPMLPFAGYFLLALIGARLPRKAAAIIGVSSVGLSAFFVILIAISFLVSPPEGDAYLQTVWTWIKVGDFQPQIAFYLDSISLIMILVVTFVGFLIHLYSAEYMADDEAYSRFFAYMNLFVGFMLTLVLADNLLLLYLGWEGVGLCSYLLIGFWYSDPANGRAARKAFIVTRVGDTAMIVGLFLIFTKLGTLQIQDLMQRASLQWEVGTALPVLASLLLLGGAVGKSAQLPLQTWLPDAMAGPTPVSALIHAATMVTAGVYLIARTHVLFALAPRVELTVAAIGAATLLIAGFTALTQSDIKRVLAYSTISQIGYMFLALGVGAWSAAMFHFMVHAFFKALLFLGAGAVIISCHHEQNMFKMGGLRKQLPLTFWTFLIGSASLAALPLITAGFYSKDMILWETWSSKIGNPGLWAAGLAGALITSLYTFRMVILTFFGEARQQISHKPGLAISIPLVILAFLSLAGGFVELPRPLGDVPAFSDFMHSALPELSVNAARDGVGTEAAFEVVAALVTLFGVYLAFMLFLRAPRQVERLVETPAGEKLHRFWFTGWGFDWVYDRLFVWPYAWIARINRSDFVDLIYTGIAWVNRLAYGGLRQTQTGLVRWYAMGIAVGAVAVMAIVVFR